MVGSTLSIFFLRFHSLQARCGLLSHTRCHWFELPLKAAVNRQRREREIVQKWQKVIKYDMKGSTASTHKKEMGTNSTIELWKNTWASQHVRAVCCFFFCGRITSTTVTVDDRHQWRWDEVNKKKTNETERAHISSLLSPVDGHQIHWSDFHWLKRAMMLNDFPFLHWFSTREWATEECEMIHRMDHGSDCRGKSKTFLSAKKQY